MTTYNLLAPEQVVSPPEITVRRSADLANPIIPDVVPPVQPDPSSEGQSFEGNPQKPSVPIAGVPIVISTTPTVKVVGT